MTALMLAAEFSPVSTTGCHRSIKFSKYLPEAGVQPTVITVEAEDGAAYFGAQIDPALACEVPSSVKVERLPIDWNPLYRRFPILDRLRIIATVSENMGRFPDHVLDRLGEVVARDRPDVLYVSLPPFATGKLAIAAARRTGLPLVVDMRDAWAFWGSAAFTTRLHFEVVRRRERALLRAADRVVTVTPQLARLLVETNGLDPSRVTVIPNGFDGSLDVPDATMPPAADADELRILYVGSFYYTPETTARAALPWYRTRPNRWIHYRPTQHDWQYRSPYFFLKALSEAFERAPHLRERVMFEYAGHTPSWLPEMVNSFGLTNRFRDHGFLTRDALLPVIERAHAFLGTSEKVQGGEHFSLPSKLFEYLSSPRPVLAFVTRGVQRDFIEDSGRGIVIDPDLPNAGARLADVLTNGLTLRTNREYLAQYHRRHTAAQLATVLREAAGAPEPLDHPITP